MMNTLRKTRDSVAIVLASSVPNLSVALLSAAAIATAACGSRDASTTPWNAAPTEYVSGLEPSASPAATEDPLAQSKEIMDSGDDPKNFGCVQIYTMKQPLCSEPDAVSGSHGDLCQDGIHLWEKQAKHERDGVEAL